MSSEFAHEVIEKLKPEALSRVKGGVLRRIFFGGPSGSAAVYGAGGKVVNVTLPERGRFKRASYVTAIGEVAETFTAEQRDAWRAFGTGRRSGSDDNARRHPPGPLH